ncbi:MAG: site-2 protease family protein [bacterium]
MLSVFQHLDTLVFFVVSLVAAITIHEFAHAWAATSLGDITAKASGRLTLNPLAHLDPMGTLMLFVVGFGWGKPVPYNPSFVRRGQWGEVLVAIAGPMANIALAFVAALPGRIYLIGHQALPEGQIYVFLATVVTLNIFLAAFNLIPIPPLDGSKILYLLLTNLGISHYRVTMLEQYGPMLLLLLIFTDRLVGTNIVFTLLEPVIALIQWFVGSSTIPF